MTNRTTPSPYRCVRTGPGPSDYRLELASGAPTIAAAPTRTAVETRDAMPGTYSRDLGTSRRSTRDLGETVLQTGTEVEYTIGGQRRRGYLVGPAPVSSVQITGMDPGTVQTGGDERGRIEQLNRANAAFWNRDAERNRMTGDSRQERASTAPRTVSDINKANADFWAAQGGHGPKDAA